MKKISIVINCYNVADSIGMCWESVKKQTIGLENIECIFVDDASTDDGATWNPLAADTTVSMNLWGFTTSMLDQLQARFPLFLEKNLPVNPLKCEYFLPFVVEELLQEGRADVKVLRTSDHWYGVTYKGDKPRVVEAIRAMKEQGLYPEGFGM